MLWNFSAVGAAFTLVVASFLPLAHRDAVVEPQAITVQLSAPVESPAPRIERDYAAEVYDPGALRHELRAQDPDGDIVIAMRIAYCEAKYDNRVVGSLGEVTTFQFLPSTLASLGLTPADVATYGGAVSAFITLRQEAARQQGWQYQPWAGTVGGCPGSP